MVRLLLPSPSCQLSLLSFRRLLTAQSARALPSLWGLCVAEPARPVPGKMMTTRASDATTGTPGGAENNNYFFQTSEHAALYAAYRPRPPAALIERIANCCTQRDALLDVGCGSGQSTEPMAPLFQKVTGIDLSKAQIEQAEKNRVAAGLKNIEYRVGLAYPLSFASESFDAITGSQCVHWFDLDKFYPEALRVLRPGGILAMYGYCLPQPKKNLSAVDQQADQRIVKFYKDEMAPFWEVDRTCIDERYAPLPRPREGFSLVEHNQSIVDHFPSSLNTYMAYLSTWSCYRKCRQMHPNLPDPLIQLRQDLAKIYGFGESDGPLDVETTFFLLMYRKT